MPASMLETMKSACVFRDQVNTVTTWFGAWNNCEQTVALCSLLKKVTPAQAKFLLEILEQSLIGCSELQTLLDEANSAEFIQNLCNESKEKAVNSLLTHLPLLSPGNQEAKTEYLQLLPKVLAHSIEHGIHLEESRQLLSYALIHPAISGEERAQFTLWLSRLEEGYTYSIHQAKFSQTNVQEISQCMQYMDNEQTFSLVPSGTVAPSNGWDQAGSRDSGICTSSSESGSLLSLNTFNLKLGNTQQNGRCHPPLHSTVSAPPGLGSSSSSSETVQTHMCLRQTNSVPVSLPPGGSAWYTTANQDVNSSTRRPSATPDYSSLSPQSSVSSGSGNEAHQDENTLTQKVAFSEEPCGMKEVPGWLKGLRLHKYAYLFQNMMYDQMLDLSEEWLEAQNVTKGARNKIILSIKKLRERQDTLRALEKDVKEGGNLRQPLNEIKAILMTPIKKYAPPVAVNGNTISESETTIAEEDLPGQITRLLGKVCTQLLVARHLDNEYCGLFLQLLDRCINHEAFTQKQKKLIFSWIQQIQKIWHPSQKYAGDKHRKSWGSTFPISLAPRGQQPVKHPGKPGRPAVPQWTYMANPINDIHAKHQLERTQSAPSNWGTTANLSLPVKSSDFNVTEPEINARLDSLCLSMTEHALGGLDIDRGSTF